MSINKKGFAFLISCFAIGLLISKGVLGAETVVQGYQSKGVLQPGWVVALDKSASQTVQTSPANDTTKMYGVVVDPSDAPITLAQPNHQVYVATSGVYSVLVSTERGAIKAGDYLTMSSVDGIAAKATAEQAMVLGRAQNSFDGKSGVITSNDTSAIGRVRVNIDIQKNPISNVTKAVPSFLSKLGNSIAGKEVTVARIYSALLIFLIAAVCSVTVLWAGVRNSLVALGRNPLSKRTIFGGMYKVIFAGLGIFIIGLAGVYLLLRI